MNLQYIVSRSWFLIVKYQYPIITKVAKRKELKLFSKCYNYDNWSKSFGIEMFTTLGHLSQFDPQAQEQIHEDNGMSEKNGDKSKIVKKRCALR